MSHCYFCTIGPGQPESHCHWAVAGRVGAGGMVWWGQLPESSGHQASVTTVFLCLVQT